MSKVIRRIDVKSPYSWEASRNYSVQVTLDNEPVKAVRSERIVHVDEDVMEWKRASHIDSWFARNVIRGQKRDEYVVGSHEVSALLKACEHVLFSSHLVPSAALERRGDDWKSSEAIKESPTIIKNVSAAHRLLPLDASRSSSGGYNADYLKAVEDTRDWAIAMLKDQGSGLRASLHYVP